LSRLQRAVDGGAQLLGEIRLLQNRVLLPRRRNASRAIPRDEEKGNGFAQQQFCGRIAGDAGQIDVQNREVERNGLDTPDRVVERRGTGGDLIAEIEKRVFGQDAHERFIFNHQGSHRLPPALLLCSRLIRVLSEGTVPEKQLPFAALCRKVAPRSGAKRHEEPVCSSKTRVNALVARQEAGVLSGLRFSTQAQLFALGVAIVVPLLVFATGVAFKYSEFEVSRSERLAEQLAANLAVVLDSQLQRELGLLRGLAGSQSLQSNDLPRFYQEARRAIVARDANIVLREMAPRQLLNTQVPFGTALPPAVELTDQEREVFRAGRPYASNVYRSPISGETRFAVALPVPRGSEPPLLLSLTAPTTRIRDALISATPQNWISAVGDRRGMYIARSERHDEATGQPGVKAYLDKAVGKSGYFRETSFVGVPLLAGYHRSEFSGWLVAANIPQAIVEAPLRNSMLIVGGAGAIALLVSMLLAHLIGRGFASATEGLELQATALREGQEVVSLKTPLADLRAVGDALVSASAAIRQREHERDLLTNELNHRVKNMLTTIQSLVQNTLRGEESAEVRKALSNRLIALSKAHDILTVQNWQGAELGELTSGLRDSFGGEQRMSSNGPPVWLEARAALAISLILNELATNAVKYGALSNDSGHIAINWDVTPSQSLSIEWIERGGPLVEQPSRRGFGSRLIEAAFRGEEGAETELLFESEGVRCRMRLPQSLYKPVIRRSGQAS
jgi:two-component sensor histidine kinase